MYTRHIDLSLLFNDFNLYKIKLLASVEQYYKKTFESAKKYKSSDVRHKFLLLDCHDKLYCLREDLVYDQMIDVKGNRDDNRHLDLKCVNVDDVLLDEILMEDYSSPLGYDEKFTTFYFMPDDDENITLSMLDYKNYGDFEEIDLDNIKINTRLDSVTSFQGCLAMPFKMINKSKEDFLEILTKYSRNPLLQNTLVFKEDEIR